jgi:hypothetical protein
MKDIFADLAGAHVDAGYLAKCGSGLISVQTSAIQTNFLYG